MRSAVGSGVWGVAPVLRSSAGGVGDKSPPLPIGRGCGGLPPLSVDIDAEGVWGNLGSPTLRGAILLLPLRGL